MSSDGWILTFCG